MLEDRVIPRVIPGPIARPAAEESEIEPVERAASIAPESLPIWVGVTGHRDLRAEDEAILEAAVDSVLDAIEAPLSSAPVGLISPLAEGADRLVARRALARGWRMVVPMPMPWAEYERSFASEASREEFRALASRAEAVFEIEGAGVAGEPSSAPYERLGLYLVRHVQELIALWDGRASEKRGGTAWVVETNRVGAAGDASHAKQLLDRWDSGPCYHVTAARSGGLPPVGEVGAVSLIPSTLDAKDSVGRRGRNQAAWTHRRMIEHIDGFARDLAREGSALAGAVDLSAGYVLPKPMHSELDDEERRLLTNFAAADALATRMQGRYRTGFGALLVLVLLALASFEVYENLMPEDAQASIGSLVVLSAYPIALGLAFVGYTLMQRRQFQDKYLDYRALAEGLRVQLFWRLAGHPQQVSDHYLRKQSDELRWIHEAIRISNVGPVPHVDDDEEWRTRAEWVTRYWIESERDYFLGAAARDAGRLRRTSGLALACYAGSLFATLAVIGLDALGLVGRAPADWGWMRDLAFLGIALSLGASALIRAYSEKMGFSEQALQYQRMRDLLVRAARGARDALERSDRAGFQRILVELGEEALQENADWVLFRRSQVIDLPQH